MFIGFTGTPLLKADRQTSLEVFGGYIHTYKFSEAVEDGVVLDLVYEARDIAQELGSQDKIDQWFEAKTKGLNDWQKAALREQWGTMQKVLSSRSRMERVVEDIVFDFSVKPRLCKPAWQRDPGGLEHLRGVPLLRAVPENGIQGQCAVITSYNPQAQDVTKEDTGANTETEKQFIYNTYTALLKDVVPKAGKTRTETYEDDAKEKFVKAAGEYAAADRRGQAVDRVRRSELHVPIHRQVDAGPRPVPGDLPYQPAGRRGQAFRLHRRLQGPVQEGPGCHGGLHLRAR